MDAKTDNQPLTSKTPPDPRVRFAAERTLLAWIRTGVSMMGFGFVVARFGWFLREFAAQERHDVPHAGWSLGIGVGLIGLGVVVNVLGGLEHGRFLKRHDRGEEYQPPTWSLGMVVSIVVAALGILMAAYLVTLSA
ncbi:YidH family protein [Zavarzinella formosa]|uniref:YidH family protein n=1 Tax=Zavarzinella formosa TaxID=360055 RepID=UPI0002D31A33|nr:DUF202 domain-containing protein [Zavarzinella formosa]